MRWCLLLASLVLSGCQPSQKLEPITLVIGSWYGFYPFFYAQSLQIDKRHNIRLKIVEPTDVSNFRRSYLRTQVDFAATSMLEFTNAVVLSRQKLIPTIITDYSNGGDVLIARKTIQNIEQLKGKRMAVPSKGIGEYILSLVFEDSQPQKYFTQIKFAETQCEKAFYKQQIDACLTYPPLSTKILEANSDLHILYDSSQNPGQIFDLLWAKQDVPESIRDNMRAIWFEVIEVINADPEAYHQYVSKIASVTPESVAQSMAGIHLINQQEHEQLWFNNEQLTSSLVAACKVASGNQCATFDYSFEWANQ